MSQSDLKRIQSLRQPQWLSNLSTALCLLGLLLLGSRAEAAGFHARYCQALFVSDPHVRVVPNEVTGAAARNLPLVSQHSSKRDSFESHTYSVKTDDLKPVETYVKDRVEALADSLSHFDRMRIFDRVLAGRYGLLGEFGKNLVNASTMKGEFYAAYGYVSPQHDIFVHPVWGRLARISSSTRAMMYHAVNFKSGVEFAESHRKKIRTERDSENLKKETGYLKATLRAQISAALDFATESYPIWRAASLNQQAKRTQVPFEFVVDTTFGNYPLQNHSRPPMDYIHGTITSFVMDSAEMRTQLEFVRWLEENPAREEYAELMFTLGLDRLSFVLMGPNGGRVLNEGKEVDGIWRSKRFVDRAKAKVMAIGSAQGAVSALSSGIDGLREAADALPYELDKSLIYDSQLQFHKAANPSALYLLWIDPNFDAFEEMLEGQMSAAKMTSSALRKQVRRVQSLRERMVGILEAGKIPWDLESNLALAEQDYAKTVDLIDEMTVSLEKYEAYVSKPAQDKRFVAEETRAKFATVEASLKPYLKKFRERTRRDLAVLKLEVEKMRSTYERSENFKDQAGPLRELARSLWL